MNTYEARHAGREYCKDTSASDPLDLMISIGAHEGFLIGSIIECAARFKATRNLDDLKKVSDYAHILCGVELSKHLKEDFLAEEDFETIAAAEKLCAERYNTKRCKTCQVGRNAGLEQISCRQYIESYPELAVELLEKDEKPEVREVERPAKVGEWIKIVDKAGMVGERYKNGDIGQVERLDETYPTDVHAFGGQWIEKGEYVVLEGYEPDKEGR